MTPRSGKAFPTSHHAEDLAVRHRHAAGIDVHAAVHFVAVAAADVPAGFVKLLFKMAGVDLTQLEAISETTALVLLSELGTELSKFPHEKNFVSWLGLCPQHRGSAGKIFKRRTRRGANRAARALRMAAQGCHRAKNALGAFYRRIQGRCGGPKAIVATARKLAERVYRMLRYGQAYVRQGEAAYEAAYHQRLVKAMAKKAAGLGYKLVPETMSP